MHLRLISTQSKIPTEFPQAHGHSSQSPYLSHTHTHGNPHGNHHTHGSPDEYTYTKYSGQIILSKLTALSYRIVS